MDKWIPVIVAIVGSGALSALITGIFTERANRKRVETGTQAGVRMILYAWIKSLGREYIERGYISVEELEDLKAMHSIYHTDLKGNGFLDTLMQNVEKLPIRNG